MGLLTPLYLIGALAISLPVLFHMIRRTPRERREFSSVMFLAPSPPRITRRSRIEHWLLLFLRSLAIGLLALAFARPYLREAEQLAVTDGAGRQIILLLDTSASMRREGIWEEAVERAERYLSDEVLPTDEVAVRTFDDALRPVVSFEEWAAIDPGQRPSTVMRSISEIAPGWGATDVALALMTAAEDLAARMSRREQARVGEIVVVSDLQSGSRLQSLQSYRWPQGVRVRLVAVGSDASPNNAGVHAVADRGGDSASKVPLVRVRVTNSTGADRDEFRIRWTDEFDTAEPSAAAGTDAPSPQPSHHEVAIIVPGGQSRIVRPSARPNGPGSGRILLEGDDHDFDNLCYLLPPRPRSAVVALLGDDAHNDPQGMGFYLPAAFASTPQRAIQLATWSGPDGDVRSSEDSVPLMIATSGISEADRESVRASVRAGGTLLFAAATVDSLKSLYALWDIDPADVLEADVDDYVMLTEIDFHHALFSSLADSKFSDFRKVRIWRYRRVAEDSLPQSKVIARFDDGAAAVVEVPLGQGRVILMTTGWHPADSQLAVSSKFVPMLNGLLDEVAGIQEQQTSYLVGEAVPLAEFDLTPAAVVGVVTPTGEQLALPENAAAFLETATPGVYRFLQNAAAVDGAAEGDGEVVRFAVNLQPSESRTLPLAVEAFRAMGWPLTDGELPESAADTAANRQMLSAELENRQKLWRWIVLAVIAVLLFETLLAGRVARSGMTPSP